MYRPSTRNIVPSRSALRVLRRLALAGSTASVIGSVCTVATISYEINRRVGVAEHLVEQKRTLESSCPNYSTTGRGLAVERMVEAAEAGEFLGLDSMRKKSSLADDRRRTRDDSRAEIPSDRISKNNVARELWSVKDMGDTLDSVVSTNSVPVRDHLNPPNSRAQPALPHSTAKLDSSSMSMARSIQYETWKSRVEQHMELDQPVEATHHFLRPPGDFVQDNIEVLKVLASRIFMKNLKSGNTSLAGGLFRWFERNAEVSSSSWEALISAQASNGNADALSTLYLRYADCFELSRKLRGVVLKSLLVSYRLGEAKKLVFKHLEDDTTCGLSAIYLGGLYSKSRNMELVETQAGKLASSLLEFGIPPTEKLFNPLLKAYIESGYDEKAQVLLEEMKSIYGIDIGLRPLGLLAYGKALKSDWQAVEQYLQQIHNLGLDETGRKYFTKIFDRIFLEYFLGNSGESIQKFVFHAIEEYDLVMDDILFEHILNAFIQKGNTEMVDEFLEVAKSKSWNVTSNKENFLHLLRDHRMSCEKSAVGLWRMFRSSQQKHGRAGASQRILDFDKDSFPLEEAYKLPWTGERTTWSEKARSAPTSGREVDKFVSLRERMIHCINAGRVEEAFELFNAAKASGKYMKQIHIELAIVASIMRNGSAADAQRILEDAVKMFPEFDGSQLGCSYKQIFEIKSQEKALKMAVFNFYRILETNMVPIKHHMVVSASAMLIKAGKPGAAIRLFRSVNKSEYGATVPFDAVALKMIARASAGIESRRGIRWAILTAMTRNSALHRDLVVELQRLLEQIRYKTEQKFNAPASRIPSANKETFYHELEYLDYLVKLLDRKEAIQSGRKGAAVMPIKGVAKRKPGQGPSIAYVTMNANFGPQDSTLQPSGLAQTLANWCERSEFETASGKERRGPIELDGYIYSKIGGEVLGPELALGHG
ncbi:hypothetical protein FQN49_001891 [Arthroderma sp. PD_2]|nr:hypothetical protein FQN49_001891 [Arthroderma sp. PD_2]